MIFYLCIFLVFFFDEDEKCLRESRREFRGIELFFDEVMLNIFFYFNFKELCFIV